VVKNALLVWSILSPLMVIGVEQSAKAQNVRAADPNSVAEAIKELGYRAALEKDSGGDPVIRSATEGSEFLIYFYGCEKSKNCEWVEFHKSYKMKKEDYVKIQGISEEWNRGLNLTTAFIDDDVVGVSYKLLLKYEGMPKELFKSNFATWIFSYADFRRKLYENLKKD
jgi:hypothetical protein